jgi:hypothetical protein
LRLVFFAGLLISMFVLTVKLLQPVSIQMMVNGESIVFTEQPSFYGLGDVVLMTASAFASGICLMFLLVGEGKLTPRDGSKIKLAEAIVGVEDEDEKTLVSCIVEAGGSMFQSDLVERSGFSKGKVSLALDRLEARGKIRRRRSGMTNVVTVIGSNNEESELV